MGLDGRRRRRRGEISRVREGGMNKKVDGWMGKM